MSGHSAAEIRAQLSHPVIDIDGHTVEFIPALEGYLRDEGVALRDALSLTMPGSLGPVMDWYSLSIAERAKSRVARGPWGIGLEHTIDQATAFLPSLLYDRLDELGMDFSVIYPSIGLLFPHLNEEDHRRGACRALNRFNADVFAPFSDRMIPVAEIPMHTPEEAVAELELRNHKSQIENTKQVDDFMHEKFTNKQLYRWMSAQIADVYFRTYQLALDQAKRAERAYQHELGINAGTTSIVQSGYWDNLRKGLLAGEQLHLDLKRLESTYLEQNKREFEITKHLSLLQLDPMAFVVLTDDVQQFLAA